MAEPAGKSLPELKPGDIDMSDPDRLMPDHEVGVVTGLGRTTRWKMRAAGLFPPLLVYGPAKARNSVRQIVAWRKSVADGAFTDARIREALAVARANRRAPGRPRGRQSCAGRTETRRDP